MSVLEKIRKNRGMSKLAMAKLCGLPIQAYDQAEGNVIRRLIKNGNWSDCATAIASVVGVPEEQLWNTAYVEMCRRQDSFAGVSDCRGTILQPDEYCERKEHQYRSNRRRIESLSAKLFVKYGGFPAGRV